MPFPFIEVDCRIHGAASGGPLLSGESLTHVVGVNCTEYVAAGDNPAGPAFGAQARCLADAYFHEFVLPGEKHPRLVTFDEMVKAQIINIEDYASDDPSRPKRGRIVLPHMRYEAPLPSVDVRMYA
jgi:hypothetical protein